MENISVDFRTLNHPEESVNTNNTGDESEWENDFSTDISDFNSSDFEVSS